MKPVILLLDDEEDLLSVFTDALTRSQPGYRVVGSTSVEQARTLLDDLRETGTALSLVIVDQVLGGSTGLEFLEDLRARFPDVPAILFTGRATIDIEERARDVGTRVLWKPVRLSRWLGEVTQALATS